ncbi:bromodomain-containing protein [Rhizophagus clarus]|uniref:Bromodomain-containing protein n=1 Tax=Rhizophagus clarus TaxID=94130 RepID=A0A8H3KUU9_9GLOM|nr:bromodomain-containing protein [Rhizophagus clarus]
MNATEEYFGQNVLISYLKKENKPSYCRFLNIYRNIIIASITTTNLKDLDNFWAMHFLREGKDIPDLYNKLTKERSHYANSLKVFWQKIIKEYEENLMPALTDKIPKDTSNTITNFCYDILHILENKSNINPFYRCAKKSNNKIIRNPMDLLTIYLKLDNEEYANINEFEEDMHLIFRNCYTYNDMDSEIYHLGEELESVFIKIWAEKTQKEELKK